ncbi:uncharacterized protein PAN0_007c3132 [Moesziomyces antarcticus]|uniref:Uncharacterized protein n=2 Tax=Pseudozyma antarctica TaxID=84753 RepID=A0A081CE20_PSEA2|nr:uncharacterized protein PAN0_007c3132 [Moesziomyces antarcticus]GAK64916.1 conserved hypothetical protein [Moesziomyces antarcticus]
MPLQPASILPMRTMSPVHHLHEQEPPEAAECAPRDSMLGAHTAFLGMDARHVPTATSFDAGNDSQVCQDTDPYMKFTLELAPEGMKISYTRARQSPAAFGRRLAVVRRVKMHRHDGSEYLPAVLGSQPHGSQVIALMRFSQESMTWNLPVLIAQTLLVAEIVRTYPAELRMLLRIVRRGRPNVAEIFFMVIKYLALIAVILDILVSDTFAATTDFACRSWAWTSSTFYFLCSTLVFCVIGWRARIIFRTSQKATYLISGGLVVQLAISMWTNWRVVKADALTVARTCAPAAQVHAGPEGNGALRIHFWQSSTFWFLLYNTLFETTLLVACSLRLYKTSSGPGGLTRIAKMLFVNNVHYMAGVETCNLIELIMLLGWAASLPAVHMTSIAIQIVVGLQMLIGEQEAVHSPSCSRVGYSVANSTTSSYAKPTTTTTSDGSYSGHVRALSYIKRPGTAGSAREPAYSQHRGRGRKGTLSSISSVPHYAKPIPEENVPGMPQRAATAPDNGVQVSIEMPPLAHASSAPNGPAYQPQ